MRFWLAILLVGLLACSRANRPNESDEKQKMANQVRRKVAAQMKQEANLCPCGTIGQMMYDIQVLGLAFYYYQPVDIVQGRKLLIKAVEAMLEEVNQNEKIRSYLVRYPFKPRNVEIQIYLWKPDGYEVPPGSLCVIDAAEGYLQYQVHKPEGPGLITVYKETYEQALERIADPSLPLVPFHPDEKISQEELIKLRKGVLFVSDDGTVWNLDKDGCWVRNPNN